MVVLRALRIDTPAPMATPWVERLVLVDHERLTEQQRARLEPVLASLAELGFSLVFSYDIPYIVSSHESVNVVLLGKGGLVCAVVSDYYNDAGSPGLFAMVRTDVTLWSRVAGRVVETNTGSDSFLVPPERDMQMLPGADPASLLRKHEDRVAAMVELPGYRSAPTVEPFLPEELENFIVSYHQRFATYYAERGVLVPMTSEEVEVMRVEVASGKLQLKGQVVNAAVFGVATLVVVLVMFWLLL